jgi:Superinfection immunity protein
VRALADSGVLWILVFTALPVLYLLPTLVGAIRRVDRLALVFLVNLIGAPTGVGWVAAMILAFGPQRPSPAPPTTAPWTPSDLPRAFRTADYGLIHAADCCSRYSLWTCCGVRY